MFKFCFAHVLKSTSELLKENEISFALLQWLCTPICHSCTGDDYLPKQDRRHHLGIIKIGVIIVYKYE